MRVTKHGERPEKPPDPQLPPPHWWAGVELACERCGCQFTLEEADKPHWSLIPGVNSWSCPECGVSVGHIWEGYRQTQKEKL